MATSERRRRSCSTSTPPTIRSTASKKDVEPVSASLAKAKLQARYLHGIHDSSGTQIAGTANNDGGAGYNSRAYFTPDADGTYYIAAGAGNIFVAHERAGEVFLNASITRWSCLGCCGRALMWEKDSATRRSEIARSL